VEITPNEDGTKKMYAGCEDIKDTNDLLPYIKHNAIDKINNAELQMLEYIYNRIRKKDSSLELSEEDRERINIIKLFEKIIEFIEKH
jgi:hypothetical protein